MLIELNISDFAIIENLSLTLHSGFNALTGETGAGKSIIIDAVGLLLGGRGGSGFIRAGTTRARVEGIFKLSYNKATIDPILEREGLDGDDPELLILSREIRNTGRSFCRVNGQVVSLTILAEIARPLIDIHGQTDHLGLLQVKRHQLFLDRYAGLTAQRAKLAGEVHRLKQVKQELAGLLQNEQVLARHIDQLSFQVEEIQAAGLQPDEEKQLNIERTRLTNAEQIHQLAGTAYSLLMEGRDEQTPSAVDLLGQAGRLIGSLVKLDSTMEAQYQLVDSLTYQIEDVAGLLRDYSESIDFDSSRLQEIEERLSLIFNLKRKYGDSIAEIISFGEQAQAELDNIGHSEERIKRLRETETNLRHKIGDMAFALSEARHKAAQSLSSKVVAQLADLSMAKADFAVELKQVDDPDGVYIKTDNGEIKTLACDERGIDRIEFLIAPNPGEPLAPLVKVASGGETSRIMLALKTVLAVADETPTLIFDEIDQGIGGRIGTVIGRKLWGLSHKGNHQVLCITHLPQIAGYADSHYHVTKQIRGERTHTYVNILSGDEQVEELAQMLGAVSDSSRQTAREILSQTEIAKNRTQ